MVKEKRFKLIGILIIFYLIYLIIFSESNLLGTMFSLVAQIFIFYYYRKLINVKYGVNAIDKYITYLIIIISITLLFFVIQSSIIYEVISLQGIIKGILLLIIAYELCHLWNNISKSYKLTIVLFFIIGISSVITGFMSLTKLILLIKIAELLNIDPFNLLRNYTLLFNYITFCYSLLILTLGISFISYKPQIKEIV